MCGEDGSWTLYDGFDNVTVFKSSPVKKDWHWTSYGANWILVSNWEKGQHRHSASFKFEDSEALPSFNTGPPTYNGSVTYFEEAICKALQSDPNIDREKLIDVACASMEKAVEEGPDSVVVRYPHPEPADVLHTCNTYKKCRRIILHRGNKKDLTIDFTRQAFLMSDEGSTLEKL